MGPSGGPLGPGRDPYWALRVHIMRPYGPGPGPLMDPRGPKSQGQDPHGLTGVIGPDKDPYGALRAQMNGTLRNGVQMGT